MEVQKRIDGRIDGRDRIDGFADVLERLESGNIPPDQVEELLASVYDDDPELFEYERTPYDAPVPLVEFIQEGFAVVEKKEPYVHGRHIDAICEHLTAVSAGEIRKLIINIPPRHMKSLLVAVLWPAWVWTWDPSFRWLFASYQKRLSTRDSVKMRKLIESAWYQERFGESFHLVFGDKQKTSYRNNFEGYRIATSVGGEGTGQGGDAVVVDDPHKVSEAGSDTLRQSVLDWWDGEMSTRVNNINTGIFVVVMQRLHVQDLTGHLLAEETGYDQLVIPESYERSTAKTTSIGWRDWRTSEGALIWPERFSRGAIDEQNRQLGSRQVAGQKQQRPVKAGGNIIESAWWQFYDAIPTDFEWLFQSWDLGFSNPARAKRIDDLSFVVGSVWGVRGKDRFVLDVVRDRMGFVGSLAAIKSLTRKWPDCTALYIEEKANGPAIIDALKAEGEIPGVIGSNLDQYGSKPARLEAVSPLVEAGDVWIPHPKSPAAGPWLPVFREEIESYPAYDTDDQVDVFTQALIESRGRSNWFSTT